jgi:hypothetical protein
MELRESLIHISEEMIGDLDHKRSNNSPKAKQQTLRGKQGLHGNPTSPLF